MPAPKKSLGQHWLFDEASLDAMLVAGEVTTENTVLEVGPGLGTLTAKLCQNAKEVIAVELDDTLATELKGNTLRHLERSKAQPKDLVSNTDQILRQAQDDITNLTVVNQSILEFDLSTLPKNYKVIANIPYYLTSNLIRRLLESANPPRVMALLVQKEVAERIAAKPGQMSILTVATQFCAEVELKELVPAELFTPPPKVDSQIIQIKRRETQLFPDVDTKKFFHLVRAGFSEKRKKLRSSLSGGLNISKVEADQLLQKASISLNTRAQELSLRDWHNLYKNI
ncbi:MAG: 16S rRNA (adenine(1518)-N(6)/adenine(1519)-N(6))-dimethyltransferase RsmA [Candidatus Saccharimonadales bacterium]